MVYIYGNFVTDETGSQYYFKLFHQAQRVKSDKIVFMKTST